MLKVGTLKFGAPGETLLTLEAPKVEFGRGERADGLTSPDLRLPSRGGRACIDRRLLLPLKLDRLGEAAIVASKGGRSGNTNVSFVGEDGAEDPRELGIVLEPAEM